ncbi:MAG: bifunctional diaminohydroxyphosphoribosylaminopyrimidine deaminase/5-amino-6-(5-phosphoribosylamino)uracil reductase RibD [Eubacteriales bacterium]|jgi:diaminohydroxyphosphoribosylaminopyrimidine deaminase/5-amino-6-(5-phosphoribosylamino)uracil reductase
MDDQDRFYMGRALELARLGGGKTSPNPMVGAVVVKDGKVAGEGYHHKAGSPHAEIVALDNAGKKAKGATLYVNLEPCCHYGRTGPCANAVVEAGICRVVVAMSDPNPLVCGKGISYLKQNDVEVTTGVLEDEALLLNEVFIKYITTGRPFVMLKAAMSIDGKIAARTGDSRWVTGPKARTQVHVLRNLYDAVLVGINTVLADDPLLTVRLTSEKGKNPVRVVVDSMARTPLNSRVLSQLAEAPTFIATTGSADVQKIARLKEMGAEVLVVPGDRPRVDLKRLMADLAGREITSVMIEGGGEINASALESGLVDKVIWFIAPKIVGGRLSPGPVGGRGIAMMADAGQIENITVSQFDEDVCLEGYLKQLP